MTKLQKRSPPAYPGEPNQPLGTRYENLPRNTQPPVPVVSPVLPSSYNDFAPTNPFSSHYNSQAHSSPDLTLPSAKPAAEPPSMGQRNSQPQVPEPSPSPPRATGNRPSVDLRRLDGQPYSNANGNEKTPKPEKHRKPFKVAKDMHDGALPPTYKRQASDPMKPGDAAQSLNMRECVSCGKKQPAGHSRNSSCTSCGKRRASGQENTMRAPGAANHTRNSSETTLAHRPRSASTGAGTASPRHGPRSCCDKCGKSKRPGSGSSPPSSFPANFSAAGPSTTAPRGRPGLSVQPNMPANNPAYPQIDIIPPSATTIKPAELPFSPTPYSPYGGDESPLVATAQAQEIKPVRKASLLRSLSRKLSGRKDKQPKSGPLEDQHMAQGANAAGRHNDGPLIPGLSDGPADRPGSPFSFVESANEYQAFEMNNMRNREAGHDKGAEASQFKGDWDEEFGPERLDVIPRPHSAGQSQNHLSVSDAERPQITRFKSLKIGVQRAASVSRATSLKRLNSLKTAHHVWYRDDMAIEGATGDHEPVAAF